MPITIIRILEKKSSHSCLNSIIVFYNIQIIEKTTQPSVSTIPFLYISFSNYFSFQKIIGYEPLSIHQSIIFPSSQLSEFSSIHYMEIDFISCCNGHIIERIWGYISKAISIPISVALLLI